MRQMCRALLASVVVIAGAWAQSRTPVEDLIDRIKGLPPEFAANLILDIEVVVDKVPPKQRIALYEEAFRLAAQAELATPLQGNGFHTETRPGWQQTASEAGLDSLTLQYRALGRVTRLDPTRLQRMFREMRPLPVQPQSCDEILRPEFSKWTGAINLVYQRGFSAAERAKETDIAFVEEQVRAITSPLQLPALSNIFAQADRRLLPRLTAAQDSAMTQVRGDWFAFQYAAGQIGRSRGSATAYRDYIVAHLRGVRCGPRWPYRKPEEPEDVTQFNAFTRHNEDLNLQPIDAAQIQPSRIEDSPKLEEFWKSDKSKQLMEDLRWLTHGNRNLPGNERFWTLEERRSVGWNERYLEFLKRMDAWSAADESSPAAYFFMRSRVWLSLVRLLPPGQQRTNAFRSAISWLNASWADGVVRRFEWWYFGKELLELAKKDIDLLDDLEHFGNPVLSTYAHVDNPRSTTKPGGWAHKP